jgi:MbtH protein
MAGLGSSATGTGQRVATAAAATDDKNLPFWRVVVNHEGQYSLWPSDRKRPLGWVDAGWGGSRQDCLAYIRSVWEDQRPLSLQNNSFSSPALLTLPGVY